MTDFAAQELREEYLSRLDEAMRGLPHGVATDIRAGIDEELEGLDAAATAERIGRLGDPAEIARGAQEETPGAPAPAVTAPPASRGPVTATKGFAITAALALGFGGIPVPVLGWIVGIVLVSLSALWKTWEKAVAILVPFVVTGLSFLAVSAMTGFASGEASGSSSGSSSGTGTPPEVVNPLVPGIGEWHVLILLGFALIPASGLWLLWRLRGRTAS